MDKLFYQQTVIEACEKLGVDPAKGLDHDAIEERQDKYGRNELQTHHSVSPLKLFLDQFKDVLIIILIVAALISLGLGIFHGAEEITESILIFVIVFAIAIVGFLNEYKAEKTVEALRKLVARTARVRRDGEVREVPAESLVPGDIVLIEEGQKIPADIRIIQENRLKANEASLTGESLPVSKVNTQINGTAALGDQKNMLFSGTLVTSGKGEGVVVATAGDTEIGKIAGMVESTESEQTPMQKKLDALGKKLGVGVLIVSIIVFVAIMLFGTENPDAEFIERAILAFTAAVALAVAAIPEGLAFVVRISLALGARRMADRNALVRKLSAVEALGSTDTICSDKTGTLTRGEMTVRTAWVNGTKFSITGSGYKTEGEFKHNDTMVTPDRHLKKLLTIGLLNNNAKLEEESILGDPTEAALLVSAQKAKIDEHELKNELPRINEVPFSSERKMMSTVHKDGYSFQVFTKGSVEAVLARCTHIIKNGESKKLTKKDREEIHNLNNELASNALRVLGFAYKTADKEPDSEDAIESDLTFVGLQGMMDPPRTEIKEVIQGVRDEAGMDVIMITGDYVETARAIAEEVGIKGASISGPELDELSQEEFEKRVEEIAIYARVNPEHKIRIVKALKKHGHQVAMTGDGVNDAPAIKAADIGIAMGVTGTDVAKEAADLILLDDHFLTIVAAVEEGRGIFDNVRKFVNYLLSANIAEVISVFFGIMFFQKLILTPAQLLFINIVTDGLPAVALGSDPSEKRIMRFRPFHFQQNIINKRVWIEMFVFGTLMSVVVLLLFFRHNSVGDTSAAVSSAFVAMVVLEMVRLVNIRSDYNVKWRDNPWLIVAIMSSLVILFSVLYVPFLSEIFEVEPIGRFDWLFIGGSAATLFVVMKFVRELILKFLPEHDTRRSLLSEEGGGKQSSHEVRHIEVHE